MRRPRWYPLGCPCSLLVLGHPASQLPRARPRGDCRMGRCEAVPRLRCPSVLASRTSHNDDGSDCSNRDGFLKTLRVWNVFVTCFIDFIEKLLFRHFFIFFVWCQIFGFDYLDARTKGPRVRLLWYARYAWHRLRVYFLSRPKYWILDTGSWCY